LIKGITMRANPIRSAVLAAAIVVLTRAFPAAADHHLMQIEQVIGGVNGDTSAQAIQLRMRAPNQNFMGSGRMRALDAAGQNPVTIIDFASSVPNGSTGDRVLVTTAAFDALTAPATQPDFTMTNQIPASYLAAGSLVFESDLGQVWWRFSWGGAGYTGPTTGTTTNDADGDFGKWSGALPSAGLSAIKFQGTATAMSTTNSADYAVTLAAAFCTNNARASFQVNGGTGATEIPLTRITTQTGTRLSGNRASVENEDTSRFRVQSGVAGNGQDWVQVQVTADSPVLNPTRLDLHSIARVTMPGVTGRIWLRNFDTGGWVLLGSFAQSTSFMLKSFPNVSSPARFIRDTDGNMLIRIRYSHVTDPFEAFIDLVQVDITP
jgi:hypothetical protein